jgi:hypothetical protein
MLKSGLRFLQRVSHSRLGLALQEKQRAETEKRSSAWLRYFLAGLAILLVHSA